jgi:hypothetical protein
MRKIAERLAQHLNDPTYWGSGHESNPDPTTKKVYLFDIWRWADAAGRRDIQAVTARAVAGWQRNLEKALASNQKLSIDGGQPIPHLDAIIRQYADEARAAGHWREYAGFLEAIHGMVSRPEQPAMLRDIIDAYARAGNVEHRVWHMVELANSEIFQGAYGDAKQLLGDAYRLSLNPRFEKGVGMILMGVSHWLEKDGRILEAHRCLVTARALFHDLHDIFAITARDMYRGLEADYASEFLNGEGEKLPPQSADELLTAFFAEADSA